MKIISKKCLDEVIELVKIWNTPYAINNELITNIIELSDKIANESGMMFSSGIYETLYGILRANEEATNEEIYSIFKILGFEVK